MRTLREKSRNNSCNTTDLSWLLIPEEWSPRNVVVEVPDPKCKRLTDEQIKFYRFFLVSFSSIRIQAFVEMLLLSPCARYACFSLGYLNVIVAVAYPQQYFRI